MFDLDTRKLDDFLAGIFSDAEREREEIRRDIQNRRGAYIAETDDEILSEVFVYVRRRASAIRSTAGRRVTETLFKNRRELFECRARLLDEVMEEVKAKLRAYTSSPDYPGTLQKSFAYGCSILETERPILSLREADLVLGKEFFSGQTSSIQVSGDIELGGLILISPDSKRRLDLSFDNALNEAKAGFMARSGFGGLAGAEAKDPS